MTDGDKTIRYAYRKYLAKAYAEIAALTEAELDEILHDPALNAAYKVHCDYWRKVQSVLCYQRSECRAYGFYGNCKIEVLPVATAFSGKSNQFFIL